MFSYQLVLETYRKEVKVVSKLILAPVLKMFFFLEFEATISTM